MPLNKESKINPFFLFRSQPNSFQDKANLIETLFALKFVESR